MGGKSGPSAPDYKGAAEQQGASSLEAIEAQTKANRPNQYTPWGSSEWQQDKAGDWSQNVNLDPNQQKALDNQMALQSGRSDIAKGMLGNANREMGTPTDFWNTLPDAANTPNVPDFYGQGLPQMGQFPEPNAGPQAPELTQNNYRPENIQRGLDFSGQQQLNAGGGYNPDFAKTQFDRQMSLQQPQMDRQMQQMETQLRNQGLSPGTPAYDNAISDLRNQQGEQTSRMSQDAMRLGADEQQRQYGRELSSRQQGVGEVGQQGMFGNQASQQALEQQLGIGSQRFGEEREIQNMYGSQANERFNRELQAAQFANQQRSQAGQEQLAFGSQGFNQQLQAGNFQSQQRQQSIAEQMQREGWSLNKINAMMSGQQVGMPQMPNFQGAGAAQGTQYLPAAIAQGNFGAGTQGASPWGAIGQIGGGMAAGGMFNGMMGGFA